MDWRIKRITQELQKHDKSLFAVKTNLMTQVWRKAEKWSASDVDPDEADSFNPTQFILALTDNWNLDGTSVEWGLDPIMKRIQEMDLWTKDSYLDGMRKEREKNKAMRDRALKNEMKARAYDMRKEFAQATNEINTSTLEKVDSRRKYGNR